MIITNKYIILHYVILLSGCLRGPRCSGLIIRRARREHADLLLADRGAREYCIFLEVACTDVIAFVGYAVGLLRDEPVVELQPSLPSRAMHDSILLFQKAR